MESAFQLTNKCQSEPVQPSRPSVAFKYSSSNLNYFVLARQTLDFNVDKGSSGSTVWIVVLFMCSHKISLSLTSLHYFIPSLAPFKFWTNDELAYWL